MSQAAENAYLTLAAGREPDSDEPEMESSLHYDQLELLKSTLEWFWRDRDDFFIGANLSVYFKRDRLARRELRGPDLFVVRNCVRRPRRSWTVWLEGGRYPDLIVELLSDETARADRTAKKTLYQDVFRTPEYFWFSPDTCEFAGFELADGVYRALSADAAGHLPSAVLGLCLGVQDGMLRFFAPDGSLVPTLAESVERELARVARARARADAEAVRADTEHAQAEQARASAEQARASAEEARARAEEERARAEEERAHAEEAQARADEERDRADAAQARAEAERVRADAASVQAQAELARAHRLAERLRDLGLDPDSL